MTSLLNLYKILNTICFCSFLLGDKDKEIYNLSDCELENYLRDFDDLPMDNLSNDMDGNFVYVMISHLRKTFIKSIMILVFRSWLFTLNNK